jgi:hypothetical protein
MDFLGNLFWSVLLLIFILACFGKMAGLDFTGLLKTYVNFVIQILVVVGEVLVKLAIPVLKQLGEKIVYTTKCYLEEQKKDQPSQIGQDKPVNKETIKTGPGEAAPQESPQPKAKPQPKTSSANPYDDPPEPEIMD